MNSLLQIDSRLWKMFYVPPDNNNNNNNNVDDNDDDDDNNDNDDGDDGDDYDGDGRPNNGMNDNVLS